MKKAFIDQLFTILTMLLSMSSFFLLGPMQFGGSCTTPVDNLYINENTTLCSGTYYLNDSGANGILIMNASNITLTCNDTTLIGNRSYQSSGVYTYGMSNVTIENCVIKNYSTGVSLYNANYSTLLNNTIDQNGDGAYIVSSFYVTLANNSVLNSNNFGFLISSVHNSTFTNNTALNNGYQGVTIRNSNYSNFTDNFVNSSSSGFYLDNSQYITLTNNTANNSYINICLYSSKYSTLENNTEVNGGYGIYSTYSGNATINNNLAYNFTITGMYFLDLNYTTFDNNTVYNAANGFEIEQSNNNNFTNTILENSTFQLSLSGENNSFVNLSLYNGSRYINLTSAAGSNFTNLTMFYNSTINVNWEFVNVSSDQELNISNFILNPDFISLNDTANPDFNAYANVTLYLEDCIGPNPGKIYGKSGFPTTKNEILGGGEYSTTKTCVDSSTINFNVSSFSGYRAYNSLCLEPYDDAYINENTTFCPGTYFINDTALDGIIIINASNITIECNDTIIIGNTSGVGFEIISDNATILNCEADSYETGFEINDVQNITILNNSAYENQKGFLLFNSSAINFTDNIAYNNSEMGFTIYSDVSNSLFVNNTATTNAIGFGLLNATDISFTNNTAFDNADTGFISSNCSNLTLINFSSYNNSIGFNFGYTAADVIDSSSKDNLLVDVIEDVDSDLLCGVTFTNLVISNDLSLLYLANGAQDFSDEEFGEILLCNASDSTITNIKVTPSPLKPNNGVVVIGSNNITFDNLNNSYVAAFISFGSTNIYVNNSYMHHSLLPFFVVGNTNLTINNSLLFANDTINLMMSGIIASTLTTGTTIQNTVIHDDTYTNIGIFSNEDTGYNLINTTLNHTQYGFALINSTFTNISHSSFLNSNVSIWFDDSSNNTIEHSLFENNTFGLIISDNYTTVSNVTLTNNTNQFVSQTPEVTYENIYIYGGTNYLVTEEPANFTNLTIGYNATAGKITWESIDVPITSNIVLNSSNLILTPNFVSLDDTANPDLNISANITTQISNCDESQITIHKKEGFPTTRGEVLQFGSSYATDKTCINSNTLEFNVSSFSGYAASNQSCLEPYDNIYINENTTFCPGTYFVNDVALDGVILINASNITVECNDTTIIGNGTWISKGFDGDLQENVTIKGCNVGNYTYGFSFNNITALNLTNNTVFNALNHTKTNPGDYNQTGKAIWPINCTNSFLTNNTVYDNDYGFFVQVSENMTLEDNIAHDNLYDGMYASSPKTAVYNNLAYNNGYQGILVEGDDEEVVNNTVYNNSIFGFFLISLTNSHVDNNTASDGMNNGFHIQQANGTEFTNNTAYSNSNDGFYAQNSSNITFTNNTAYDGMNNGFHIQQANGTEFTNNTAYSNVMDGFYVQNSSNITFINNTANNNSDAGIRFAATYYAVVYNNTAQENGRLDVNMEDPETCTTTMSDMTLSGDRPLLYINATPPSTILNEYSEVILCNASDLVLSNITIIGSDTKYNNGLLALYSQNITVENLNNSNNYINYILSSTDMRFNSSIFSKTIFLNNLSDNLVVNNSLFNIISPIFAALLQIQNSQNATVENSNFYDSLPFGLGLALIDGGNHSITNLTFRNFAPAIDSQSSENNSFEFNTITNSTIGIRAANSNNLTFVSNTITDSGDSLLLTSSENTTINSNTFYRNAQVLILQDDVNTNVTNNLLCNNTVLFDITNSNASIYANRFCVSLYSPPNNTITNITTQEFNFSISNVFDQTICFLDVNNTENENTTVENDSIYSLNHTFDFDQYEWRINCSDGNNTGTSDSNTITFIQNLPDIIFNNLSAPSSTQVYNPIRLQLNISYNSSSRDILVSINQSGIPSINRTLTLINGTASYNISITPTITGNVNFTVLLDSDNSVAETNETNNQRSVIVYVYSGGTSTPTPTPTASASPTPTTYPTASPTITATASPSGSPTPTTGGPTTYPSASPTSGTNGNNGNHGASGSDGTPTPNATSTAQVQTIEISSILNSTVDATKRFVYTLGGIIPPSPDCGVCDVDSTKNCHCVALWFIDLQCGPCWLTLLILAALSAYLVSRITKEKQYIITAAFVPFIIAFATHCCTGISLAFFENVLLLAYIKWKKLQLIPDRKVKAKNQTFEEEAKEWKGKPIKLNLQKKAKKK